MHSPGKVGMTPQTGKKIGGLSLAIPSQTKTRNKISSAQQDSSRAQALQERSNSRRTWNRSSADSSPRLDPNVERTLNRMESVSEVLTPLLLNLYVAYTDNRSEKMNYRSFTELLNHMKVIEKSREAETSYLKVFREFAVKSGNEYFVTHTEFPNLLKQIKMLNSTRLEFQSNKAFNNLVRVLLKNKFKHFQSLFGDSSEFLIDTIVSNSNFAPY